ncbi:MAG: anti-sigma factor [Acidimicrobiales bacterium]
MAERPTACEAWQADLAGWLSAQLPPDREAPLADHLAGCETCRAEADSLLAVAAVLLGTDPESSNGGADQRAVRHQPPPDLGDRILAAVAATERRGRSVRIGLGLLLAAAAIAAFLVVRIDRSPDPFPGDAVAFTVTPPGSEVTAVLSPDDGGTLVQLTATGLEPDVTYALWMSAPDATWQDRVPAGTFRPNEEGRVDATLHCAYPPNKYARVWATTPEGEVALDTKRE